MPLRTDDRNAKLATMQPLILASASPQRRTLLQGLGISFEVMPSSVDEKSHPEKADPAVRAQILAREKANDVAAKMPGRWVLGCDTLVVAPDGSILEKPSDADDARRMLRLQSGGVSLVHSGLTLISPEWKLFEGCSSSPAVFDRIVTFSDAGSHLIAEEFVVIARLRARRHRFIIIFLRIIVLIA